ncbi:MAG: XRE family transcriptional regulator [Oxalobacteraceae bacterium]|nr:MAG: XRE family transcriptional regulator [Oxalobacteraceae bacterium]
MTYAQCIEARRLLGLSQSVVAKAIGVSVARISNYETSGHLPRSKTNQDRLPKLKAFFEQAGVEFIEQKGGGPGVKLRRQPE